MTDCPARAGTEHRVVAADGTAPVVVHCAAGKDRTGLLTALVLGLVGVGDEVVADYARSGLATDRFVAFWRARPGGGRELWPGYDQAPAETMRLFPDELAAAHGSMRSDADEAGNIARLDALGS